MPIPSASTAGSSRRSFLRNAVASSALLLPYKNEELWPDNVLADASPLAYHPKGMYMWDTWYFTKGSEVHLIHLQKKRPGSSRPDQDDGALGHAVSTDLLTWQELPVALYPGKDGSIDDHELWTGCTVEKEGIFYLFYTARTKREEARIQRTCLATSTDTILWTKRAEPVIVPDDRWYAPTDCRDLIIVKHPQTREYHGFYAAKLPGSEVVGSAAIAHVRSHDLIHWTHEPPAFAPQGYGVVEVPDVFFLDGRWWMTCLTGNHYGIRADFSDPNLNAGTIYASSDRLEGPYLEGLENVLIGSMGINTFSCRSLQWQGERYVFYTQNERVDQQDGRPPTMGTLTTPKVLRISSDNQLTVIYSPLIEQRTNKNIVSSPGLSRLEEVNAWKFGTPGQWQQADRTIMARSPYSWSIRAFGPALTSFMLTGELTLTEGRAIGFLFRTSSFTPPNAEPFASALAVLLDYRQQALVFTELGLLPRLDARKAKLTYGQTYLVRIIAKGEFFEIYLNDALMLAFVRYQPAKGQLGLYIEAGEGFFEAVSATALQA